MSHKVSTQVITQANSTLEHSLCDRSGNAAVGSVSAQRKGQLVVGADACGTNCIGMNEHYGGSEQQPKSYSSKSSDCQDRASAVGLRVCEGSHLVKNPFRIGLFQGRPPFLACLVLLVQCIKLNASTLHVEGEVRYESLTIPDGRTKFTTMRHFIAQIGTNGWMIRSERDEGATDNFTNLLASECWFDGLNLQVVDYFRPEIKPLTTNEHYGGQITVEPRIHAQTVPAFGLDMHLPIWLGYASVPYFQSHSGIIADITAGGWGFGDSNAPVIKASLSLRSLEGFLVPEEILFTNIGRYRSPRTGEIVSYQAPYDLGFLKARYRVLSWVPYENMERPSESELVCFSRGRGYTNGDSTPEIHPFVRVSIRTSEIQITAEDIPDYKPPTLDGTLKQVRDYRTLVVGKPLTYITASGIVATNDSSYPRLVQKMQRFEEDMRRKSSAPLFRAPVAWAIFLLILLAPFLMLKRNSNRNNSSQPTTKGTES
jgi:hypothetical protein